MVVFGVDITVAVVDNVVNAAVVVKAVDAVLVSVVDVVVVAVVDVIVVTAVV